MSVFTSDESYCHKAAAYISIITAVQLIDVWQIYIDYLWGDNQKLLYWKFPFIQQNEIPSVKKISHAQQVSLLSHLSCYAFCIKAEMSNVFHTE